MHERAPTPTTKTTTIVWICATWVAADRKRAPEMMTQGYNDTNGQQKGRTQDRRKEGRKPAAAAQQCEDNEDDDDDDGLMTSRCGLFFRNFCIGNL